MSKAGINSNIGDEYQVHVAAYWAMKMLADKNIEKLECEALLDETGERILVDDLVVRYKNAEAQFCQCKVNSPTHKDWSVSTLKDDLKKTWDQFLRSSQRHSFMFYSSTSFGNLSKLAEVAQRAEDIESFEHNLPQNAKQELQKFQQIVNDSTDSRCWQFFKNCPFGRNL